MCLTGSEGAVASAIGMLLGWVPCHLRGPDGMVELAGAASHAAWRRPRAGIRRAAEKGVKSPSRITFGQGVP